MYTTSPGKRIMMTSVLLILMMLVSMVGYQHHTVYAQNDNTNQDGPRLSFPTEAVTAKKGDKLVVPISFLGNGNDIRAITFAVDFDSTCLSLDSIDEDGNGIPDSVNILGGSDNFFIFDPEKDNSKLFFSVMNRVSLGALSDGTIAEITFDVTCSPPTSTLVSFLDEPPVSFGSSSGQSVQGTSSGPLTVVIPSPTDDKPITTFGAFTCASQMIDMTGVGMYGSTKQSFIVPDSLWSIVQVGGAGFTAKPPTATTFRFVDRSPLSMEPTTVLDTPPAISPVGMMGYVAETIGYLGQLSVDVHDVKASNKTPNGMLVYYGRPMPRRLLSGTAVTTIQYAWGGQNNEDFVGPAVLDLTLPEALAAPMDVRVKVAVMDKDADGRIAKLRAEAGGVVTEKTLTHSTDPLISIEELILSDVPTGTTKLNVKLISPRNTGSQWNQNGTAGDSVFLLGATTWYECKDSNPPDIIAEEPVAEEPIAEEPVAEEPVAEEPIAEEPVAEEPVAEEPVTEEPVAEEPVAEEPVAEEPVAEEPVAEEPVAEEPVAEEPVAEEPVAEEPVAEEPVAEEPVAEEPVAEEPVAEESVVAEPIADDATDDDADDTTDEDADDATDDDADDDADNTTDEDADDATDDDADDTTDDDADDTTDDATDDDADDTTYDDADDTTDDDADDATDNDADNTTDDDADNTTDDATDDDADNTTDDDADDTTDDDADDTTDDDADDTTGDDADDTGTAAIPDNAAMITPEEGGQLIINGIMIVFPVGAVTEDTMLYYREPPEMPDQRLQDGVSALRSFILEAFTADDNEPVTEFLKAYVLTVSYTTAQVEATNSTEAELTLAYWDIAQQQWVYMSSEVDTTDHQVQANLDHFTEFALLAGTPTTTTTTNQERVYLPFVVR